MFAIKFRQFLYKKLRASEKKLLHNKILSIWHIKAPNFANDNWQTSDALRPQVSYLQRPQTDEGSLGGRRPDRPEWGPRSHATPSPLAIHLTLSTFTAYRRVARHFCLRRGRRPSRGAGVAPCRPSPLRLWAFLARVINNRLKNEALSSYARSRGTLIIIK